MYSDKFRTLLSYIRTALAIAMVALLVKRGGTSEVERLPPAGSTSVATAADQESLLGMPTSNQWTQLEEFVGPYVDYSAANQPSAGLPWDCRLLPDGLVWRSYLAGVKEPRFAWVMSDDSRFGTIWDATLGARVALLRYGTPNAYRPDGWEMQFEGAAQPRLWPLKDSAPLISCDYRVGIPLVYANGPWQFKTGYHHTSAHLGDEFMLLYPEVPRFNYMRDSWMLAVGCYVNEDLRLYAEMDYAFVVGYPAKPWQFQFGADYSPAVVGGAPFAAVYGDLRQELDFGGYFVFQIGWQWRGGPSMKTFRIGLEYVNGHSTQDEFIMLFEQRAGFGVWYDF